jgi:tRNA threonylcarbamoyladenosine biosynthesis protein TsaE
MNAVPATLPAADVLNRFAAGWTTRSPAETEAAGVALAGGFPADHALALHGGLGAGKTTFVRGLARGWGLTDPIPSPTFNYYFIYRGSRQLVHLDAYRLTRPADAESLLVDEFLQSPWCLAVEWPENLGDRLPPTAWHLDFRVPDETTRVLTLRRAS